MCEISECTKKFNATFTGDPNLTFHKPLNACTCPAVAVLTAQQAVHTTADREDHVRLQPEDELRLSSSSRRSHFHLVASLQQELCAFFSIHFSQKLKIPNFLSRIKTNENEIKPAHESPNWASFALSIPHEETQQPQGEEMKLLLLYLFVLFVLKPTSIVNL